MKDPLKVTEEMQKVVEQMRLDDLEEYIKKQREELIRIKPANFDKITECPETLAEFIDEAIERAVGDIGGRGCPIYEKPTCEKGISCVQCITWWLKQKVEEGENG